MRRLIIAGVDPGTIIGYALLDIDGNLVKVGSLRNKSLADLIGILTSYGKVVIIGTDKDRIPSFIKEISRSVKARVICPDKNLNVFKKIKLVDGYLKFQKDYVEVENRHEKDALAIALYSYKRIRNLFKKIDDGVKDKEKAERVKEIVLLKGIYISEALKEVN